MTTNLDTAKALVNSRIVSGAPGSITATKLNSTLVALIDAIVADRVPANIPTIVSAPLAGANLEAVLTALATTLGGKADIASPTFTGTPAAPTADVAVSSTQIATTAFVQNVVAALIDSSPSALDTLNELAAALGDDADFAGTVTNALAAKLALAGGTLTGFLSLHADPTSALHAATKQYVDAAVGTPVVAAGTVEISFDAAPQSGYVELDGATIAGGEASYPGVAARYPWMISSGDIKLPDFRGRTPRGWAHGSSNDPDRATRGARAGDGQTGDYPGTTQSDQYASHSHTDTINFGYTPSGGGMYGLTINSVHQGVTSSYQTFGSSGGSETRGKNLGVMFSMKVG